MDDVELRRFELSDPVHGAVPCATARPRSAQGALPLCLFLYGGGGSRETLADVAPLLSSWWASGRVPPMLVATPDVGAFSFYLDDPARGVAWESFVVRFAEHLRAREASDAAALVGISMGGYGALKIAFARPHAFRAVAVVSPMIEPGVEAARVPLRNRFHYPPGVPEALLGPRRDPELYRRDHPAARARANADALRSSSLAIAIDAAGSDALNAHDGAEHLHRVLWALDVAHDYRLRRDADHVGPDLVERLADAFAWVGAHLAPRPPVESPERAALHAYVEPLRRRVDDETIHRRYGVLT